MAILLPETPGAAINVGTLADLAALTGCTFGTAAYVNAVPALYVLALGSYTPNGSSIVQAAGILPTVGAWIQSGNGGGGGGTGITSLTGDVTAAGPGAAAATIAAGAVSPTKLANIPNNTVLGNVSGVASNPSATSAFSLQMLVGVHPSVTAVATANITLSGTQTIDGIAVVAGNRVLCVGQSTASQNGVYVVAAGAWSYATDWATGNVVTSTQVSVDQGTSYAHSTWTVATAGAITVGTTAVALKLVAGDFSALTLPTSASLIANGGPIVLQFASGTTQIKQGTSILLGIDYQNGTVIGSSGYGGRLQLRKGGDVASASTITLPSGSGNDGNYVHVTGTTGISFITTTLWQSGSEITLYFPNGVTLTHNASSPPANTAPMLLAGSANFTAAAGARIKLVYDSALAVWLEVSRVTP